MRKIKSYEEFNEEVNWKQLATGAALTAGLALGSPSKTVGQQVDPYNLTSSRLFPAPTKIELSIPMSYLIQANTDVTAKKLTSDYLEWVEKNFKPLDKNTSNTHWVTRSSMQVKDLENSTVVIKCCLGLTKTKFAFNTQWTGLKGQGFTYCTIEFKAKDGKYKISFSDIYLEHETGTKYSYDFFKEKISSNEGFNIKYDFVSAKACVRYIADVNNEIKYIVESIEDYLKNNNIKDDF